MSTLVVVEEVLREQGTPMVVRDIVAAAGLRLPTRSKTPATVVARDLAMDIKRQGPESKFARVAPGLYTLRELVGQTDVVHETMTELAGAEPEAPVELTMAEPPDSSAPSADA